MSIFLGSFFIFHVLSAEIPVRDTILKEHLQTLGIDPDQELAEISHQLRKHVVNEFLGPNMTEYSSFLISSEQISYEETAKNCESNGFFDCELGNAAILALANIMRIVMVVFTSLENYPVITIVPRNEPIVYTTVYLAFEQIAAGHYDAVILMMQVMSKQLSLTRAVIQALKNPALAVDVAKEELKINRADCFVKITSPGGSVFEV